MELPGTCWETLMARLTVTDATGQVRQVVKTFRLVGIQE